MMNFKDKHPNTFLIGASKCGTSAMSHFLSQHPNVFCPDMSDPRYDMLIDRDLSHWKQI
jgi:hypothetical protein